MTTRDRESGTAWKVLAVAQSALGKDALQALQTAAALLPRDAEAHANLGNALRARGRLQEAIASYTRALELEPDAFATHHNVGNALLAGGQPEAAAESYRRALRINPSLAEAHCNLGNALRRLGRLEEAADSYRSALVLNPRFAAACSNLGDVLRDLGRFAQAAASCRRAIELEPHLAGAHNSLGNALLDLGLPDEAAASYRHAVELDPGFAGAQLNLALLFRKRGQADEAQAICRSVLAANPNSAPALVLLADLLADRGKFAEAEALIRQAMLADPRSAEARAGIAYLRRMTVADAPWAAEAQALATQASPLEEVCLRFALGKYYDDVGDYGQAFGNYRRAHELVRQRSAAYDRQHLTHRVDQVVRSQDGAWLQRRRDGVQASALPVLILGMPRSGTSLAEQILASHPDVFGAGELPFWGNVPDAAGDADLVAAGEQYLQQLAMESNSAQRVIDKMPANFWHAGHIHAALPNARIIHMQRNPVDTCLSIYFQHFEHAQAYAHDLADLAHYYRGYLRLMQHWRSHLPAGVMLEVPYEGLVGEPEAWSRRMLDFLGLRWDARCLEFSETERRVMTSSKWQVRQKISRASIDRWRHYEQFIGPLLGLAMPNP